LNLYFLVEGRQTEKKVYRKLIPYLLPKLTEVKHFDAVKENNFYIFIGGGYPNIKNVLLKNRLVSTKTYYIDIIDYPKIIV
jgi:hypothetical protein